MIYSDFTEEESDLICEALCVYLDLSQIMKSNFGNYRQLKNKMQLIEEKLYPEQTAEMIKKEDTINIERKGIEYKKCSCDNCNNFKADEGSGGNKRNCQIMDNDYQPAKHRFCTLWEPIKG